ncbi:lipopolysaccharide biosynthesis protein RfbH [Thermodesulfovibrio yellowstonii]|uniref:lipopolysaccharide biosynthesis protein RfbH n=1 Tax=Thermodesulfovibrio yellowstonii TaxID=28262 RepID=UPI0024B37E06|nr:lipopolysaccharide biosynthesis protein RfbH [Thermodesulfovibrio yellowstonii]MDI6865171.1 lipopolysaccharide biosynthesis protein RfbH [Thermodesulfovibrio yellowstonii]
MKVKFSAGQIIKYKEGSFLNFGLIIFKISETNYIIARVEKNSAQTDRESSIEISRKDLISAIPEESFILNMNEIKTVKADEIVEVSGKLKIQKIGSILKNWGKILAKNYYDSVHLPLKFTLSSENIKINYGGRVFDEREISNLIESVLDFWLTAGVCTQTFEQKLAKFLEVKYCSMVNSGSSANLLAFMALTSPKLGDRRIKRGDEVITVATSFPTTVAPIIQYGAIPVFVDITLPTYNIDCSILEEALSQKTKAVMLAHTMGNPFDIEKVKSFCERHNLWLIEDNCDSLGAKYCYRDKWQYTGTFGDIATSSFYPPHHITTGEGGAVYTNNPELIKIVNSLRDWGRDCWCPSGKDNTCRKRFKWKLGELPYGYDHKYIYSHFGYNLKATDMQAAVGVAQLDKLPDFIQKRNRNWKLLKEGLKELEDIFILPEATENSKPSWFGFLLTVRDGKKFSRDNIVQYLEMQGIQTRMLFAGNIIRHPCFDEMRKTGEGYNVVGELKWTDKIMRDTFWVGVYPGITEEMIDYMIEKIKEAVKKQK